MQLQLHEQPAPTTVYSTGISVSNMTWWFWIKAGMGLTIGAGIVSVTSLIFYALFWVNLFLWWASTARR